MINIYIKRTEDKKLSEIKDIKRGSWVNIVDPSNAEIESMSKNYSIPIDLIYDCLDKFEKARYETEEKAILFIFRVPFVEVRKKLKKISTIPVGIILTKGVIFTISLKKLEFVEELRKNKKLFTSKRTRMILQIVSLINKSFLKYLRMIEKEIEELERSLRKSVRNVHIIRNLSLRKTLTYFSTSSVENNNVLKKIFAGKIVKLYKEDAELLEDLIVDSNQTIEMVGIYSKILSSTLDSFSSVISNNLNRVMKMLAALTVILAIPNIISGFYGMNLKLPLALNPNSFLILTGFSSLICAFALFVFIKKGWI